MADKRDEGGRQFFEIGAFRTPLQALREEYASEDPAAVEILEAAARLAAPGGPAPDALANEREHVRRMEVDSDLIRELSDRARQIGEESYTEQYALTELLQAASVGNATITVRNVMSINLALAAKQQEHIGRAREAYTDVFGGVQILDRLFQGLPGLAEAQETARRGWESVKSKSPGGLDVFDPEGDPATYWERLLVWNSDLGSGQGLLSQADATLRLALHFEHWLDRRGGSLDEFVPKMIDRCAVMEGQNDERGRSLLAGRLLVTIGDALLELAQWKPAASAFARAATAWPEPNHPLYFHASAQEAYALLMLGDLAASRRALDRIDGRRLEDMAEMVLTVAAEAARYGAVDALWMRRSGKTPPSGVKERVEGQLRKVAIIFSPHPSNRVEYLRTLFFALTARDVETMMRG